MKPPPPDRPEGQSDADAPSFPPAPSESPFRVSASRAPVRAAPVPSPVVVSRPEPPVVEDEPSARPGRPEPRRPIPPSVSGQLFEPRPSHPFMAFLAEHPRLGGLILFVGFGGGAVYLASRIAHPGRYISRGRALNPLFMHASAALAFAGLWFLLVEVPVTEKHTMPTWWKVGLLVAAVIGAAVAKPLPNLLM